MKTVFTNSQCAHVWAAQTQESGRTPAHSMSFEGPTIYSYRTAIARIHALADGTKLVLINSGRYSMTTSSKHMPAVHRAVNHLPSLGVVRVNPLNETEHAVNLEDLRANYQSALKSLERRRDVRDYDYERLTELASNARRYAAAFGLWPVYPDGYVQNDIRNMQVFRAERDARLNTPQAIAARDRAKVKRDAKRTAAEESARIQREEMRARYAKENEERRIEEARTLPERIEKWRRGELTHGLHSIPPMLRISRNGTTIQTSHGAEIPLEHGLRALRFIAAVWSRGETYNFDLARGNPTSVHVGHFTIDAITATQVRAGCHNFERTEIEQFTITTGALDHDKTSTEQSAIG